MKRTSGLSATRPRLLRLPAAAPRLRALRTLCTIFYLLNGVELPEFFEDHIAEWMGHFHKWLAVRAPAHAHGHAPR